MTHTEFLSVAYFRIVFTGYKSFLSGLICLLCSHAFGQFNVKDSAQSFALIKVGAGLHTPQKDLANRFGLISSVGVSLDVKTKFNLLCGAEFSYLFGNDVKEDPLSILRTPDGNIIGQDGLYAGTNLFMRGYTVIGKVGYVFGFKGIAPNRNCGPFVTLNAGFLEHHIRIEVEGNNSTALTKESKKGYDRRSNGGVLGFTAGYKYLSNRRLLNFYAAFEFMQALTANSRGFNYDTKQDDHAKRKDQLIGFKLGWIIPLYKRLPNELYFN